MANCASITGPFAGKGFCKNNIGGIKTLWIADYDDTDVVTVNNGEVSKVANGSSDVEFFKFPLPIDLGDAVEDVTADPKLGTAFVTQTINGTLLGLAKEASVQLSQMFKGKQRVIAELYDGSHILYGEQNGLDITGGGSRTGAEAASLQGYEVTFTGKELNYAPFAVSVTAGQTADSIKIGAGTKAGSN